jgi:hypothetical protein
MLLYQNVQPRVVMDLLGHSEIRVTMDLYSHVAPALQRDAANKMDALFKRAKNGPEVIGCHNGCQTHRKLFAPLNNRRIL